MISNDPGASARGPWLLTRSERFLIRRRSVKRRDGNVVEPQIDGELAAMVGEVIDGRVANRDVAQLLRHHLALDTQTPGRRQQVLVGGGGEGLARPGQSLVERLQELRVGLVSSGL